MSRSCEEIFSEILSLLELTRVGKISSSSVPRPRRRESLVGREDVYACRKMFHVHECFLHLHSLAHTMYVPLQESGHDNL
jgi:G:T-mismatch repair DNA endonuclease (very short patch repair protein)